MNAHERRRLTGEVADRLLAGQPVAARDARRVAERLAKAAAPVFPGETIRTEIWRNGAAISFRARAVERDTIILNNGLAVLAGGA